MQTDAVTETMLPADATWAGAVLLAIAGLFLAALVIGIVARLVMPERYVQHPAPREDH